MFIAELHTFKVIESIRQRKWISYPLQLFLFLVIFIYGVYLNDLAGYLEQQFNAFTIKISPGSFWFMFTDRYAPFRGKLCSKILDTSLRSSIVATSLILFAELSDSVQVILSSRVFQWLGKHSFALYLLHTIFQSTVLVHVKLFLSTLQMLDAGFIVAILTYIVTHATMAPFCMIFTLVFDEGSVCIANFISSLTFVDKVLRIKDILVKDINSVKGNVLWSWSRKTDDGFEDRSKSI